MSVDAVLDDAFTLLLDKARKRDAGAAASSVRPPTINFNFGGGGAALVVANTDPQLVEVGYPMTLVSAHIYAGDANGNPVSVTTATVDLRLTNVAFGASTSITGATPAMLTGLASANLAITDWQTSFVAGDAIIGRLSAFTGTATWVALVLTLRPSDVPLDVLNVIDETGNQVVDNFGNLVVMRG